VNEDLFRNVLINGVLVMLGVLVALSSLELALYAGIVSGGERAYPHYEACEGESNWQPHQEYGWTLQPGAVYVRQQNPNQEKNLYRIDSNGFRDSYNEGDESIVVLGDSHTAGWIVDDNDTFSHLLDTGLPNSSVRNFAVPGYGTEQELAVYSDVSDSIDHELVVVAYYAGNDMTDNTDNNSRRPQYAIRNGDIERVREPVMRDFGRSDRDGSVLLPTRTISYLKPQAKSILDQAGLLSREPPDGDELDHQLRLTRALIQELGERADDNGAELLVVIIPERTDVDPTNPARYEPEAGRSYWDSQRRMLRELSGRSGNIRLLDLTPVFIREHESGKRIYGGTNAHLDEHGHEVTARVLNRWMAEEGYSTNQPNASFRAEYAEQDRVCPN